MSGSETGTVMTTPFSNVAGHNSPPSSQNMRLSYTSDGAATYTPLPNAPPQYQLPSDPAAAAPPIAVAQPPQQQNMNVMGEVVKKKRGRPRKYGPDGSVGLLTHSSAPPANSSGGPLSSPPLQSPPSQNVVASASGSSPKKGRGRPPGSKKKQHLNNALGKASLLSSLVYLCVCIYTYTYMCEPLLLSI